jgi:pyridinium-3,5-bisthiocarboxylic acid mononucleotide nickel chelatase
MRIAYLDCSNGVSGDMFLAALLDAGIKLKELKKMLSGLAISGYSLSLEKVAKPGQVTSRLKVKVAKGQHFRSYRNIKSIIQGSKLPPAVKRKALGILKKLGQTEAKVHCCPLNEVHFHEIGAVDTIIDIVGVVWALDKLGIKKLYCSPVNTGSGKVKTAHGILPVPAPATAELLKGIPSYSSGIKQELATPTGAALVAGLCSGFGTLPEMDLSSVGASSGSKECPGHHNIFRLLIGKK